MVAINFHKQFAERVKCGLKRQTIRSSTKAYEGCKLQLYTGQRTKRCVKLKEAICTSVQEIRLGKKSVTIVGSGEEYSLDWFATLDGFLCYKDMWKFFEPRIMTDGFYYGHLIKW